MSDLTVIARYYGPQLAAGEPHQIVIHSVESDIVPGLAASLAGGWFRNPANETSAHDINDPRDSVTMVPDSQRAWHCGNGNNTSLGVEHTGRAAFTRAQWTTPDGLAMLRNSARYVAREARKFGIPARWLTLTQLAANEKGLCTHNDMRLVRGGTTHTDPGPGFPYDLYLQYVREAMGEAAPADVPGSYTVKAGDTLSGIGGRAGIRWEDIAAWNGITAPYTIYPGQVLKLTGGVTATGGDSVPVSKPAPKPGPHYGPMHGAAVPAIIRQGTGNYYGSYSGGVQSRGGFNVSERPAIKLIQQQLIYLGYVPGVTDINSDWADGIFDNKTDKPGTGPTSQAVARFQRAHMPNTRFYGQVWFDDWAKLATF